MGTKTTKQPKEHLTRRRALGALAAGAGAVLLSRANDVRADRDRDDDDHDERARRLFQWLAWDDGYAYKIKGCDRSTGHWVVAFRGGAYTVDPAGHVMDSGIWYEIAEVDCEGLWYDGEDGQFYLLQVDADAADTLL